MSALGDELRRVRRNLMGRYTPSVWNIFVPGTDIPDPSEGDLEDMAERFERHFKAWGGTSLKDYLK